MFSFTAILNAARYSKHQIKFGFYICFPPIPFSRNNACANQPTNQPNKQTTCTNNTHTDKWEKCEKNRKIFSSKKRLPKPRRIRDLRLHFIKLDFGSYWSKEGSWTRTKAWIIIQFQKKKTSTSSSSSSPSIFLCRPEAVNAIFAQVPKKWFRKWALEKKIHSPIHISNRDARGIGQNN